MELWVRLEEARKKAEQDAQAQLAASESDQEGTSGSEGGSSDLEPVASAISTPSTSTE